MKEIISFSLYCVFFSLFIGCKKSPKSTYYGYFIDSLTRKPIAGVLVKQIESGSTSISDSSGYFEIAYGMGNRLHIYKKGYMNDTVLPYISSKKHYNSSIDIFQGEKVLLKKQEKKQ